MEKDLYKFLICFLAGISINISHAQLIVIDTFNNSNINDLAQSLVGVGVEIFNVQYQCADSGLGIFNGINSNLGLNEGIILTSGNSVDAIGPNNDQGAGNDLFLRFPMHCAVDSGFYLQNITWI